MNMTVNTARRAIESLRSGVPSRYAVERLGSTQDRIRGQVEASLLALESGQPVEPLAVAASFGSGKTHLLEYLQHLAESQGFVTSYVVVSPEMPLGNPHAVLKAIAETAEAPGRVGKALRALAPELSTGLAAWQDVRKWAEVIDARFPAMLHLYESFLADEDLRVQILDDFQGKPLTKTEITRKLKEIGAASQYDLGKQRGRQPNALLAHDRIRLLARLFRAAGCKGWVVLFDELERMHQFSVKQRHASYEEIGWWHEVAGEAGSGILPLFTMTAGFLQETVTGGTNDAARLDHASLGNSFEARDRRVYEGIELLKKHVVLEPTTTAQDAQIRERIRGIYEDAYEVSLPAAPADRTDDLLPVRSKIRKWITQWDLSRYYEGYRSDVRVGNVEFDAAEIGDAELDTGDEEG